jgi:hypothetical protein
MSATTWSLTALAHPCPVCGKPDGCLVVGNQPSPPAAICTRIESTKEVRPGVWLHVLRPDGPMWAPWKQTVFAAAKRTVSRQKEL